MFIALVMLTIFAAVFVQGMVGFGSALISMPLLSAQIDLHITTPLVALLTTTMELVTVVYFRKTIHFSTVWKLSIPSLLAIPLGVAALDYIPQDTLLIILGVIVIAYALYALLNLRLPSLAHPAWVYLFGFIAGLLGGSFNTNGPPVVIYGDCRRWGPEEFKSNLQGFFLLNNFLIIASHAWRGNFTPAVWHYYLYGLPAIALGLIAGIGLGKKIQPDLFRKLVLVLLVVIGLRLIF